jgi:hypothetical protein
VEAVQIPSLFPESLAGNRAKTTCVPSGERLGSVLMTFVPPAFPTTDPDGTPKTFTGHAQPVFVQLEYAPAATRSPAESRENGSGGFLPSSLGF